MEQDLRKDAEAIVRAALAAVRPDDAVRRALAGRAFPGRIYLAAAGKAAWQMAAAALGCLPRPVERGVVVTKCGHVPGPLENVVCYEGGHPVPDEGGFAGTQAVLDMTAGLRETDTVLFPSVGRRQRAV